MYKFKNKVLLALSLSLLLVSPLTQPVMADQVENKTQAEQKKEDRAINGIFDEMMIVGDDFVTGMKKVGETEENKGKIYFEQSKGAGLTWLKNNEEITAKFANLKDKNKKRAIVFLMGFNETSNPYKVEDYINYYIQFYEKNIKAEEGKEKNTTMFIVNIPPIDDKKYKTNLNDKILVWNAQLKAGLPEQIKYIDVNKKMAQDGFETLPDGYHYTDTSYQNLLDYIMTKATGQADNGVDAKVKPGETIKGKNSWGTDEFGYRVFYDDNGNIVKKEFRDIDKATYYFDDSGHYVTGLVEIGDNKFFFNQAGIMKKNGLAKVDDEGHIMLFDGNGKQLKGWQTYESKKYYFGKDGWALTGWWTLGTTTYYFNEDGSVARGLTEVEGKTFFFNDDGSIKVGWHDDGKGGKYFFGEGGEMYIGIKRIDNKVYAFGEDGKMIYGWYKGKDGRRYFDEKTGVMVSGEQIIKGKRYIFDKNGILQIGWVTDDKGKIFYDEEGNTFVGRTKIGEKYYFFDKNGYMLTGWQGEGKDRRYYDPGSGVMATGWTNIDANKYYFTEDGIPLTGIKVLNGKLSFFDNDGRLKFAINLTALIGVVVIGGVLIFLYKKKKEGDEKYGKATMRKSGEGKNTKEKTGKIDSMLNKIASVATSFNKKGGKKDAK